MRKIKLIIFACFLLAIGSSFAFWGISAAQEGESPYPGDERWLEKMIPPEDATPSTSSDSVLPPPVMPQGEFDAQETAPPSLGEGGIPPI